MNYVCAECRQSIPSGMAVIRSESLRQVTLHKTCFELRESLKADLLTWDQTGSDQTGSDL